MSRKVCLFSPRSGGGFLLSGKNKGGKEGREQEEEGKGERERGTKGRGAKGKGEGEGRNSR